MGLAPAAAAAARVREGWREQTVAPCVRLKSLCRSNCSGGGCCFAILCRPHRQRPRVARCICVSAPSAIFISVCQSHVIIQSHVTYWMCHMSSVKQQQQQQRAA